MNHSVMMSCIDMGPSEEDKNFTKLQMAQRQQAWCVMLGIDYDSEEFKTFKNMYFEVLANNLAKEDSKNKDLS